MEPTTVSQLIEQLSDPDCNLQVEAAEQLGLLGDPTAESALLDSLAGKTYPLIRQDGSAPRYFWIIASAAQALARLNTDSAWCALVSKIQENKHMNQCGTAAAVYGISFSPRTGIEAILRSVVPRMDEDSGDFLRRQIDRALEQIRQNGESDS